MTPLEIRALVERCKRKGLLPEPHRGAKTGPKPRAEAERLIVLCRELSKTKSIREIAEIVKVSPTSVWKWVQG